MKAKTQVGGISALRFQNLDALESLGTELTSLQHGETERK
jgi:hypothetical protein